MNIVFKICNLYLHFYYKNSSCPISPKHSTPGCLANILLLNYEIVVPMYSNFNSCTYHVLKIKKLEFRIFTIISIRQTMFTIHLYWVWMYNLNDFKTNSLVVRYIPDSRYMYTFIIQLITIIIK